MTADPTGVAAAAHEAATRSPSAVAPTSAHVVFAGGLKNGWQDWGWAKREIKPGAPARLDMSHYAGWILANRHLAGAYGALDFEVRSPQEFGDFLSVRLATADDDSLPRVAVVAPHRRPLADGWFSVRIGMAELNPQNLAVDRIRLWASRPIGAATVEIDHIALTAAAPGAPALGEVSDATAAITAPMQDVTLSIDCGGDTRPISPLIYGTAFVPRHAGGDAHQWELGTSARRWGGNPASRYNWKLGNAWNTASDYFFLNVNYTNNKDYSWKDFLAENHAHEVPAAITVPTLGWVAKDTDSYAFSVANMGPQQFAHGDAGNGMRRAKEPLTGNDPNRTSIPSSPEFVRAWVRAIEAAGGGVVMYILDNEPMLWNSTHRDVHPDPTTYDELTDKLLTYGHAVREAAPKAIIAAPASWGWPGYFFSAKDADAGFGKKPDRRAHGDVPLINHILRALRAHERKTGERIVDVVDWHFYPQSKGLYGQERTDPDAAARRIRATRSLWDPSYTDESWINDKIRLLPRLTEIIAAEYPGLKMSLGEYNFGGENHISGGLALAEALGRFGQHGLHSAFYWTYPPKNSAAFHAFRAYRNYDGHGAHFLDRAIPTTMARATSLFASQNAKATRMVAIALNLDAHTAQHARIDLKGCGQFTRSRTFVYTGGASGLRPGHEAGLKAGAVGVDLPPYSITVVELGR